MELRPIPDGLTSFPSCQMIFFYSLICVLARTTSAELKQMRALNRTSSDKPLASPQEMFALDQASRPDVRFQCLFIHDLTRP